MRKQVMIGLLVLTGVSLLGAGMVDPSKPGAAPQDLMTIQALQDILSDTVQDLKGGDGHWRFTYADVQMALLTSRPHDRMRIVAPIGPEAELTGQQRKRMLEANFHSALDARYATSNGLVYVAYIHPLSPLRREEMQSALRQIAELVKTFGTAYSSGELSFGSPSPPPKSDRQKEPSY